MSKSVLIPVVLFAAVVLYGTTRAGRPAADAPPASSGPVVIEEPPSELLRIPETAAPPAAPRLRSEVETDSAAAARIREIESRADSARARVLRGEAGTAYVPAE